MNKAEDKEKLLKMANNTYETVAWFGGSGGEVYKFNYNYYALFEASESGKDCFVAVYQEKELDKLLDTAYSWT